MQYQVERLFGEFDPAVHVSSLKPGSRSPLNTYAGLDPGWSSASAFVHGTYNECGTLWITGVRVRSEAALRDVVHLPVDDGVGLPCVVGLDPTCATPVFQTGISDAQVMESLGFEPLVIRMPKKTRLMAVRALLKESSAGPRLRVAPWCTDLIEALVEHRQRVLCSKVCKPATPKYMHVIDAFSYLVIAMMRDSVHGIRLG